VNTNSGLGTEDTGIVMVLGGEFLGKAASCFADFYRHHVRLDTSVHLQSRSVFKISFFKKGIRSNCLALRP
jgi:hypothetical protein